MGNFLREQYNEAILYGDVAGILRSPTYPSRSLFIKRNLEPDYLFRYHLHSRGAIDPLTVSIPPSCRAVLVTPGVKDSERLGTATRKEPGPNQIELRILEVGICGTDIEIATGLYGEAPSGHRDLVPGHESLAEIESLGSRVSGLAPGQLVVPIVRRPCDPPCKACASGRWDLCLTGHYQEHGIKSLDGFLREYAVVDADTVISVPTVLRTVAVLVEPLTIVEKALEEAETAYPRHWATPQNALVTGAGPVGLLAALLLRQRGLNVTVLDKRPTDSPKAVLVRKAGIHYINSEETPLEKATPSQGFDWIVEATGYSPLLFQSARALARNGVLVLTGVTSGHHEMAIDSDMLNQALVLENQTIVGSVNAARHHYLMAVADLIDWSDRWPGLTEQLITARHPLEEYAQAYGKSPDAIKSIVIVNQGGVQ